MAKEIEKPLWMKKTKEEMESLILDLHEQGVSPERIGLELRDTYGIPSARLFATKVSAVIAKAAKSTKKIASDLTYLKQRVEVLKKHVEKNKQDKVAKRGYQLTVAKVNKLTKYYQKKGSL